MKRQPGEGRNVTLAQNVINLFYVSYIDKVKIPAG
jgi:hypothetical protein